MFRLLALLGTLGALSGTASAGCPSLLDHHVRPLAGEDTVHLCEAYRNQVVLVVNTASQCGFTPQYEGLTVRRVPRPGAGDSGLSVR